MSQVTKASKPSFNKVTKLFLHSFILISITLGAEALIQKGKPVDSGTAAPRALPVRVGPKKIVAVEGFENKVENPDTYWYRNSKLGSGFSEMLVTALMDTDQFIVLEREKLDAVLAEQDLAASGRTTATGHAKIGKINQSQYLITGAVTVFEEGTSKKAGGVGVGLKNVQVGLGGSAGESQVAVDIRIYDTATSQVIAAKTCKGFAKSTSRALALGVQGTHDGSPIGLALGGADFKKTPLGDATRDAIQAAINFIAFEMGKMPWRGFVLKTDPSSGQVFINSGERNNIRMGDKFSVFGLGEGFVDPETGESLGSEESFLGVIRVIETKEKYSICNVVSGSEFEKGNIIKYGLVD